MAGGKETPRQKMIGMMYLVLTALLALNVSKQIVAAFITLNNKIDNSAEIIDIKAHDAYQVIENKRVSLIAQGSDTKEVDFWNGKAMELKKEAATMVGFILGECNDMIKDSEGDDWVAEKDEDGNITKLRPLEEIDGMDNYDIPTSMFVGGNPNQPNERGQQLVDRIHEFRNYLTTSMGTYEYGGKQYAFVAPESEVGLAEALSTANEDDTSAIAQMYRTLTIPEELYAHGEEEMMPWVSVTFDHAPIVAAAAMFTSLKLDIKNAEAQGASYFAQKIDAEIFKINKIEPMAIAPSAYINMGDSLPLFVRIAAYDTTDQAIIKYGVDADTLPERWIETTGGLNLAGQSPGTHRVKGVISVQERGQTKWKPWSFDYTVGQPTGVVAQPEMRVLYWGYDNVIEATGSGFANENISVTTSNCRLTTSGGKKIIKVDRGTRQATIGVVGKNDDGSTMSLGSYQFKCVPLPSPELKIDGAQNGTTVPYVQAKNFKRVRLAYDESITLTGVKFKIKSGEMRVDNVNRVIKIGQDGIIPESARSILNQSRGKNINGEVSYTDPSGITKRAPFTYKVI